MYLGSHPVSPVTTCKERGTVVLGRYSDLSLRRRLRIPLIIPDLELSWRNLSQTMYKNKMSHSAILSANDKKRFLGSFERDCLHGNE